MADQDILTAGSFIPDGFRSLDSDDESEADSLHIESAEDITLPFSTHLPDFLPSLDTVTVTLGPDGCDTNKDLIDGEIVTDDSAAIKVELRIPGGLPPVTPTKPQDNPALGPVTPTANLKILMSAASPEIRNMEKRQKSKALFNAIVQAASLENLELEQNMEIEVDVEGNSQGEEYIEDGEKPTNRKSKSLGLLCQRFLSKYPNYPANGQAMEISLDAISKELCVERRRIYDIVNVLESVEMVQRQAKNKYLWHGKTYLVQTLVKLKCLGERNNYASQMERLKKVQADKDYHLEISGGGRSKKKPLKDFTNTSGQDQEDVMAGKKFLEEDPNSRRDKSLGVMSQKFIMLFLVSKNQLVTLDIAARVLIGDINYEIIENSKFKTKVRRLYDIANILTSLQMIKKVHIHERRGRKPAFRWIGPNPDISDMDLSQFDLNSKPVIRHSHFPPPLATAASTSSSSTHPAPIRPKSRSKKTNSFTRHSSFNIMRKVPESGSRPCSSAPSSPVKREGQMAVSQEMSEKFKREFDTLRTKYPDCMSKLFAACNIEQELLQKQQEQQQLTSMDNVSEGTDQVTVKVEVSDQLQTARKVLNLGSETGSGKSQASDSNALSSLLTETVDSLHCALRDAGQMRRSKRTIKQPVKEEFEYQPVVKRSKMELQALAALGKYSDQKTHITLQRVKTENLTEQVMSELACNKLNVQVVEDLPPDLAVLQESVGMMTTTTPAVSEGTKCSAFVPVTTPLVQKATTGAHNDQQLAVETTYQGSEVNLPKASQNQEQNTKVQHKQLPDNRDSSPGEPKPNLPLIRNPTKTIHVPSDFVKKLLCNEQLDIASEEVDRNSSKAAVSPVDRSNIFVSTKPVNPAVLQTNKSPTDQGTAKVFQTSSRAIPDGSKDPGASETGSPNSLPFQAISQDEAMSGESSSSQTESNSQASSLHIPLSPYLQLCQGSSRGVSPLLSRCSSLGSVAELERFFGTDSQVSAQCRSKSVSPSAVMVQGASQSPTGPVQPVNGSKGFAASVAQPNPNSVTSIPKTFVQTPSMTAAAVTTPVGVRVTMPVRQVALPPRVQPQMQPGITFVPTTCIPVVTQSPVGQFMPISSVLPPHTAGPVPMQSPFCNSIPPCGSNALPTTHIPPPPYTTTPAGLITPTTCAQPGANDINYYRTPTTLPLGSGQPKAFLNGQALGMQTPYVFSGVGGAIGQLQPVSRRLTLTMPPFSQN